MMNDKQTMSVIVFGPGYGESIVIFIPGLGWGVIDSCECKVSNRLVNPALELLKKEGVQSLAFIILTHPHEDHYSGLAQIIDYYTGRIDRICYYSGDGLREYRMYLAKKSFLNEGGGGISKLVALFKKIDLAKSKGAITIKLQERTEIVRKKLYDDFNVEMLSLSPAEESVQKYVNLLFEAIPKLDGETVKEITDSQHNLLSSVIWLSVDNIQMIFGSDLEKGNSDSTGWKRVVANEDSPDLSAHVVKVPHHGSSGAFCEEAWIKHADKELPVAIITPYVRSSDPLPRRDDLEQIKKYANPLIITALPTSVNPKKVYDRNVIKHASESGLRNWKIFVEPDKVGYVRIDVSVKNGAERNIEIEPPAYIYDQAL